MDSVGFYRRLVFSLIRLLLLVCSNITSNESPTQYTKIVTMRFGSVNCEERVQHKEHTFTFAAFVRVYKYMYMQWLRTYIHADVGKYIRTHTFAYIHAYIKY